MLQLGASQLDGNESSAKKLLIEVKKMLKMFVELLLKYVKTSGAQVDCLKALESVCLEESHFLPIIAKVHTFFENLYTFVIIVFSNFVYFH